MTGDDAFKTIAALKAEGRPFAVATVVRTQDATSAKAGAKAIVTPDNVLHGWIGGGCVRGAVRRAALQSLEDGKTRLLSVKPGDALAAEGLATGDTAEGVEYHRSMCPSGGTVDIFVEPMLPRPALYVCGASPVALAIADLAQRLGFSVTAVCLAEDRPGFSGINQFVGGFDLSGEAVSEDGFIVVATQGKRDREALASALKTDARYIAFIGSRAKAATLKQQLVDGGLPAETAEHLKSPAGLDIGAITPEEIALSIMAEIVAERRRGIRAAGAEADDQPKDGTVETRVVV